MAENSEQIESTSQKDYEPTAYEDSSWEVVGELVETKEFVPMPVQILPATTVYSDPMFADYGGIPENPEIQRWHLPDELLVSERRKRGPSETAQEIPQVSLTEQELATLKDSAYQEGRLAGVEEAASQSNERMAAIEKRISEIISDLSKQTDEHRLQTEKRAINLAIAIAHKLTHHSVEINPEYILPIIREGLGLAATAVVKTIKVSPQDLEFIQLMGISKILKERDDNWEFVADAGVRAGCILETSAGEIDFDLESAFARIKDQALKVIK